MVALWTTNDTFFMHGRHRVGFHFITLQFLCTGARIASLTPDSDRKAERGLHYMVRITYLGLFMQKLILRSIFNSAFFEPIILGELHGGLISNGSK
jgi:hypothetical protein